MVGNGSFPVNNRACEDLIRNKMRSWQTDETSTNKIYLFLQHEASGHTTCLERSFEGFLLRAVAILVAAAFLGHIQLTWETEAQLDTEIPPRPNLTPMTTLHQWINQVLQLTIQHTRLMGESSGIWLLVFAKMRTVIGKFQGLTLKLKQVIVLRPSLQGSFKISVSVPQHAAIVPVLLWL